MRKFFWRRIWTWDSFFADFTQFYECLGCGRVFFLSNLVGAFINLWLGAFLSESAIEAIAVRAKISKYEIFLGAFFLIIPVGLAVGALWSFFKHVRERPLALGAWLIGGLRDLGIVLGFSLAFGLGYGALLVAGVPQKLLDLGTTAIQYVAPFLEHHVEPTVRPPD